MILALDVGNTNITIGLFENGALSRNWRLRTIQDQTADEWGILLAISSRSATCISPISTA